MIEHKINSDLDEREKRLIVKVYFTALAILFNFSLEEQEVSRQIFLFPQLAWMWRFQV